MKDQESETGEIRKRREKMADERRYIIYFTFETGAESQSKSGENKERKNV
jgi:hypothetical protein